MNSKENEKDIDFSPVKDITLEMFGAVSDKQKELILENLNKSIKEYDGVINLEKTILHGQVFVVKSANFIVKNGIYKITKMGDGLLVSDTKQGRDGTDFLRNIEKLNFKDITNYQATTTNNFK